MTKQAEIPHEFISRCFVRFESDPCDPSVSYSISVAIGGLLNALQERLANGEKCRAHVRCRLHTLFRCRHFAADTFAACCGEDVSAGVDWLRLGTNPEQTDLVERLPNPKWPYHEEKLHQDHNQTQLDTRLSAPQCCRARAARGFAAEPELLARENRLNGEIHGELRRTPPKGRLTESNEFTNRVRRCTHAPPVRLIDQTRGTPRGEEERGQRKAKGKEGEGKVKG